MNKRQIQLIILGDGAVGKTSLINQYTNKQFSEEHLTTLGLDFATRKYQTKSDGSEIPVKIWDTAGQERFRTITYSFYRRADGIIISYDVTDEKSFKSIENWVESIKQHADQSAPRILVGNKIDLTDNRQVSREQGQLLAKQYGIGFYETSAKQNIGL